MNNLPLIGGPKLSDAPLLPDDVIVAYIDPLQKCIAGGASYAQPVTLELLVAATALRDLHDLRTAIRSMAQGAVPIPVKSQYWQAVLTLLPENVLTPTQTPAKAPAKSVIYE